MAHPHPKEIHFTYQDYLLTSDDKRYELIEGELLMAPAPDTKHQSISGRLFTRLDRIISRGRLGYLFSAPCDVVLSDEDVVQPDIFFISSERRGIIGEKNIQGPPDLVIEILSSKTLERDRIIKRKLYAKFGVMEYWIVDPKGETVEVCRLKEKGLVTFRVYPKWALSAECKL